MYPPNRLRILNVKECFWHITKVFTITQVILIAKEGQRSSQKSLTITAHMKNDLINSIPMHKFEERKIDKSGTSKILCIRRVPERIETYLKSI